MKINNLVAELAKQNLTNDEILWFKFCESFNLDYDLIENRFFKIDDEDHYYKILGLCWKSNHEIEDGSDFLNNELIIHYKKFKKQKEYHLAEPKNTNNSIPLCDSINSTDSLNQSYQNCTSIISTLASTQTLTSATHTFNNSFNDYLININEKIDSLNSNNKLMDDENYMTFDELFKYYYPENNRNYQWPEIKLQKFKIIMI